VEDLSREPDRYRAGVYRLGDTVVVTRVDDTNQGRLATIVEVLDAGVTPVRLGKLVLRTMAQSRVREVEFDDFREAIAAHEWPILRALGATRYAELGRNHLDLYRRGRYVSIYRDRGSDVVNLLTASRKASEHFAFHDTLESPSAPELGELVARRLWLGHHAPGYVPPGQHRHAAGGQGITDRRTGVRSSSFRSAACRLGSEA